jgi:hypothetical protein
MSRAVSWRYPWARLTVARCEKDLVFAILIGSLSFHTRRSANGNDHFAIWIEFLSNKEG